MVIRLSQYNVENSRKGVIVRCCESTEKRLSLLGEGKASQRSLTCRAWRMSRRDPGEGLKRSAEGSRSGTATATRNSEA